VLRLKEFEKYLVDTDGHISSHAAADGLLIPGGQNPVPKKTSRMSWKLPWSPPKISPQPDISSSAKACWALLLNALGIRPGMDIVGWRPSNDGFISTQNGGIEMEIDGAVLCHIMNIYALSLDPDPWALACEQRIPRYTDQKLCQLPFGTLAWETPKGQIHAHFEPGLETELNAEKAPFGRLGSSLEPNTWIATYFAALMHGVSDPDLRLFILHGYLRDY
jgi:hypothetical protein